MLIILLGLFWGSTSFADEITVAAAASVQYALEELKAEFEKDTGIKLKTIIGSSGKLTAQIEQGAPFEIFLSADMDYPQALYGKELTHNEPKVYAYGILVLWTLKDVDLSKGIVVLTDASVRKIALPTPKTAPYGRQAVHALKHYKLYERVSKRLVYGESIAQTSQFITTGASDIGFTAKSVVVAPPMSNQGKWIEVDQEAYEPIAQGAVILKYAERHHLPQVRRFYEFLFSEKAREIYQKYGYVAP